MSKVETSDGIASAIAQTRTAYQDAGQAYDMVSTPFQLAVVYPKLIASIERVTSSLADKRILDVGCGSGRLMQILQERGAECWGVDIAPVFVELARTRGLQVMEASMHALPFPSEDFDIAVSNYALNYLPPEGQTLALQEQFRVLRPGGVLAFTYMHPSLMRLPAASTNYFHPKREHSVHLLEQTFNLHLLDWPEIVNMVARTGFRLCELIDAEVPENLEEIAAAAGNDAAALFVCSFRFSPYACFVVATKE